MTTPRHQTLLLLLAATFWVGGCGTEIGNPKKPKDGGSPPTTSVIADSGVAADLIGGQADEIFAGAVEDVQSATLTLGLDAPTTPEIISTCTANADGSALVEKDVSGPDNVTFTAHGQPATYVAQLVSTEKRNWVLPGATLDCDAAKDALAVDWTTADGLTMDGSRDSTATFTITRTGPRGTFSRNGTAEVSGTRHAVWHRTPDDDGSDGLVLTKTLTSTLDKTVTTHHHGQELSVASHIVTTDDAPIQIEVLRDKATQAWRSKTIVSGTVTSTQDEGSRFESSYDHLVFSTDSGCAPDSGTIKGATYAPGATTPTRTFTVSFDQGVATITFDDGTQAPYVPGFCTLN